MNVIAHISKIGEEQSVHQHLQGTAELCEEFAKSIGLNMCGRIVAGLHDIGKYTHDFKDYIVTSANHPDNKHKGPDHSTAGAIWISRYAEAYLGRYSELDSATKSIVRLLTQIISLCIMSHHSGLVNVLPSGSKSSYLQRLEKDKHDIENGTYTRQYNEAVGNFEKTLDTGEFEIMFTEAVAELKKAFFEKCCGPEMPNKKFATGMLCKFLCSCLIDADRIDTVSFYHRMKLKEEIRYNELWNRLVDIIEVKISRMPRAGRINSLRQDISEKCMSYYNIPCGIYSLNSPTGSGKNFAIMRWALHHAKEHNKKHIYFFVPYISIIEQNSSALYDLLELDEVKKDFGDIMLELHSAKQDESRGNEDELAVSELASETMDSPIVFASMVRFLNVIFGSGTKNIRALHNLADSIIVFDEIQTLTPKHMAMFNGAINFLTSVCNCTVILSTATQPVFHDISNKQARLLLNETIELSGCTDMMFKAFKRTEIELFSKKTYTAEAFAEIIADKARSSESVMAVLNTKSAVTKLYNALIMEYGDMLEANDIAVCLMTTNLCAEHRKDCIDQIKARLGKEKVILICTRVIEAGVDISFECVFRSITGLDSVIQCAGRCNRNGEIPDGGYGRVWIIKLDFDDSSRMKDVERSRRAMEEFLYSFETNPEIYDNDMESQHSIKRYFLNYNKEEEGEIKYRFKDRKTGLELYMYDLLGANSEIVSSHISDNNNRCDPRIAIAQSFKTAADNFKAIDNYGISVIVPYHEEGREIIAKLISDMPFVEKLSYLRKAQRYMVNITENVRKSLEGGIVYYQDIDAYILREGFYDKVEGICIKGTVSDFYFN